MQKVKEFWINSYTSDVTAFYFELVSFIFTVGASMLLAVNADNPDMLIVYPGFFIGSLSAIYAYWRRRIPTPMILTTYFAVVNIFGYGVASYWW